MSGNWDVIVVGGGPAGSAVAARLSSLSHRVLLLERSAFPREKPCGECLSPGAVAELADLGALQEVSASAGARLLGWRIHSAAGDYFQGDFQSPLHGLAISRADFDTILLDRAKRAGAVVRTGQRVIGLVRSDGRVAGVQLKEGADLHARLVIGADGLRSVVLRRLGLIRRKPRLRKLALTAHVRGVGDLDQRGELHVRSWGCIGVAPLGGEVANVTVVLGDGEAPRAAGSRENCFDGTIRSEPRLETFVREGQVLATGPFDWPVRSAVAAGSMLIGDASGYYDPFTGQGIFRALRGAALASAVADRALRTNDLSERALMPYDRARRRAFAPGVRLQHLIEAVVQRPALMNHAVRSFRGNPQMADALVAAAGDVQPVSSLLDPRLLMSSLLRGG